MAASEYTTILLRLHVLISSLSLINISAPRAALHLLPGGSRMRALSTGYPLPSTSKRFPAKFEAGGKRFNPSGASQFWETGPFLDSSRMASAGWRPVLVGIMVCS